MKQTNKTPKNYLKTSFNLGITAIVLAFLTIVVGILGLGALLDWFDTKEEGVMLFGAGIIGVVTVAILIALGAISLKKIDHYGKIKGKVVGIVLIVAGCLSVLVCLIVALFELFSGRGDWQMELIFPVAIVAVILSASICFIIYLLVQIKSVKNKKS